MNVSRPAHCLTKGYHQFAGFSSDSLAERMSDCKAKMLVTADGAWRGEKLLMLKKICDEAIDKAEKKHGHKVETCLVVKHVDRVTPCGQLQEYVRVHSSNLV